MRQAGRYLPEYRELKERYGFWRMCRTPELAAEITLQPVRRFPLDAAILFSDIMTPLPAMGVDIDFDPGPVIRRPVRTPEAVRGLRVPTGAEVAPRVCSTRWPTSASPGSISRSVRRTCTPRSPPCPPRWSAWTG